MLNKEQTEQYKYMCDLKRTLDASVCLTNVKVRDVYTCGKGHCVLEMPSGTGKTVSLLSLIVAYQQVSSLPTGISYFDTAQFFPTRRKLIYCSRTVPEIEKALTELKRLMEYRIEAAETEQQKEKERGYTGLGLSSRRNLCLHPQVSKEKKGNVVDARCRDLTSASACEKGRADPGSVPLCDWHEASTSVLPLSLLISYACQGLNDIEEGNIVPSGIWTLADITERGRKTTTCPYFTIRRMVSCI